MPLRKDTARVKHWATNFVFTFTLQVLLAGKQFATAVVFITSKDFQKFGLWIAMSHKAYSSHNVWTICAHSLINILCGTNAIQLLRLAVFFDV